MSNYNVDHEGISLEYYKNDFAHWDKEKEIEYNNNEIRQKAKYQYFQQAYDYIAGNYITGDYYEFGCHKARTFRMSLAEARKKNIDDMHFYAFDSFEGLPTPKGIDEFPCFEKGLLATSVDRFYEITGTLGLYDGRIHAIKGFYEESLTKQLQKELIDKGSRIAMGYIDCDLYESTKDVLEFIEPLLQDGSIICFDDWNLYKAHPRKGERRAFNEFKQKTSLQFEEFLTVGLEKAL